MKKKFHYVLIKKRPKSQINKRPRFKATLKNEKIIFVFRTGSICINDRIHSINGKQIDQPSTEIQQLLNNHIKGNLLLGMSKKLQIPQRLAAQSNGLQHSNSSSRVNSLSEMGRSPTPIQNRLNLIDIQKVIGVMATSIQNKE